MKTYKTAIITGAIALVAVIATVIILSLGNAGSGLYIAAVSGDVLISSPDGASAAAAADSMLSNGDILTVNESGSCRLVYRSRGNANDENYIVLEPSTQVFVTGEFNGKSDSELFLNRGAVFVSSQTDCSANVIVRTESSSYTTKKAVMRISYDMGETQTVTNAVSFGGSSEINLYDSLGNPVDRNGYKLQSEVPEILGEGRTSIVVSGEVPTFDSLNVPAVLSDYSASTLRELFTASSFGALAFSAEEIKTAYDNAPEDMPSAPAVTETTPAETSVTTPSETTPSETTVPESETEETTTTTPYTTTAAPQTTTTPYTTTAAPVTTTAAPVTTAAPQPTEAQLISVYIIIEDEIIVQEVEYGGNASQPSVPEIPGKKFIGWDGDFTNITEETTITAIFEDDPSSTGAAETTAPDFENPFENSTAADTTLQTFTVTIIVNGQSTTQSVPYGGNASLPIVSVPGYTFLGWEGNSTFITSDTVITAILVPDPTYNSDTETTTTVTSYIFSDVTL
ncbi:MAG: InlB B-repeat-containing protein [Huintestinicola sp.]|uniref:InlB B-repeat-containing protein n=1 Tax=Huintestinicola sp. TaxID=2981661 RepID=UPI003F0FAD5B